MPSTELLPAGDAHIEVLRVSDQQPDAFLLPAGAGGVSTYADLCQRLTDSGLPTVALNPRGCGASTGSLKDLTVQALADDVAAVILALRGSPAVVMGHAGGNRLARVVATWRPDAVRGTVLLAAGGKVQPSAETLQLMRRTSDPALSEEERTRAMAEAYYARCNGHLATASPRKDSSNAFFMAFLRALSMVSTDAWWPGGSAPMLVLQGAEDRIAPPANGQLLAEAYPERVRLVNLEDAGHALVVEQPERITREILAWTKLLPR